jgi:periplasmic divalent cation tolerance protein
MTDKIVVLVTAGSAKEARRIGQALVEKRLAACVSLLQVSVQSIYRWKGKVETAKEVLMLIKSSRGRFKKLEEAIKAIHGYDLPEIIALPIESGSREYLAWLSKSVAVRPSPKKSRR